MADKRAVRKQLYRIESIKTWQLVIILILMLIVAATFLRINYLGMDERRRALINADKIGDEQVIHARIADLQKYSSSHMNASTERVELVEQYKRDSAAILDKAKQQSQAQNGETIFTKADQSCKQRFSNYSQAYVQCVAAEISNQPSSISEVGSVKFPDPGMYRYDFASPGWTPDFAGWSVVSCIVLMIIIVVKTLIRLLLQYLLKRRYSQV